MPIEPFIAALGKWHSIYDRLPDSVRSVLVWRQYGYVANPEHSAYRRIDGIEISSCLNQSFVCDLVSTGLVTHWLDAAPPDEDQLRELQAKLREYPAPSPFGSDKHAGLSEMVDQLFNGI